MCKNWEAISNSYYSWSDLKSLNVNPVSWGVRKKISHSDFKIMLESALKRCGRFLMHLVFDVGIYKVDNDILNLVRRECPNLQDIELTNHQSYNPNDVQAVKSVFDKVKKFKCSFEDEVTVGDLEDLFSVNEKLECLCIRLINSSDHSNTCIPFDKICHVSLIFNIF